MSHIVSQIPDKEIKDFYSLCSTIGAYIIFPSNRINNKMTINGSRGLNKYIKDPLSIKIFKKNIFIADYSLNSIAVFRRRFKMG